MASTKKRGGSGGSKQKNRKKPQPHARAPESDDDGDDMEEETDGLAPKKKVSFGAQFMLFRVLMLASGVPVDFARGAEHVSKLVSAAAQGGAKWARRGTYG